MMYRNIIASLLLGLLLIACSEQPESSPQETATQEILPTQTLITNEPASQLPSNTPESGTGVSETPLSSGTEIGAITPGPDFAGDPLPTDRDQLFSGSGTCSMCHSGLRDSSTGVDVSIDTFWRSTMMANAARDPYWQAAVRAEVINNPGLEAVVEDKCSTCHMPMARTTVALDRQSGFMLDDGFLDPTHPLHNLALDGVSCTLCHQIEPDGFGEESSFSGGFVIDPELPQGERMNYGPYEVIEAQAAVMQASSGYIPQLGTHIQEAELCATCHTLYTPTINEDGEVTGTFPEQMAYFEWLNSDYAQEKSCQDCHMPVANGGVQLSITGGEARSPFSKHEFVGGNTYVLGMLRAFGAEIGVTSSSEQLEATRQRANDQLVESTANIVIESAEINDDLLNVEVHINNLTGHKFPTGFPSRRAWLHLSVQDSAGQVVFDSGGWRSTGEIVGNDNDSDGHKYEPHYSLIDNEDQVQIYESILADGAGAVTTRLLRGASYLKDNRLPPGGFNKNSVNADIAVFGEALTDPNFQGGSDIVTYSIGVNPGRGPFSVIVQMLYQSIGYRWAINLAEYNQPEIERFLSYYDATPNEPVVVSQAGLVVE